MSPQRGSNGATAPPPRSGRASRAVIGTILPEREYELPILQTLVEAGGRAPAGVVTDRVGELLDGRLTDEDRERLSSGDIRWRNRCAFTRLKLVQRGLLADNSPHGTWEITARGREHVREGIS